jgi:hypothetical protein
MRTNSEALGKQTLQQKCQRDWRDFVARGSAPAPDNPSQRCRSVPGRITTLERDEHGQPTRRRVTTHRSLGSGGWCPLAMMLAPAGMLPTRNTEAATRRTRPPIVSSRAIGSQCVARPAIVNELPSGPRGSVWDLGRASSAIGAVVFDELNALLVHGDLWRHGAATMPDSPGSRRRMRLPRKAGVQAPISLARTGDQRYGRAGVACGDRVDTLLE